MTHFAENLTVLRKRAGYTQETLAEALGVSRQAVGKWESGQGLPEASTLLTLADLLGCTLDQLMRDPLPPEDTPTTPPPYPTPTPPPDPALTPDIPAGDQDPAEVWAVFSLHMDRFAAMIALGVFIILAGTALTVAASVLFGESPVVALPVLLCVAGAVFLFVFGGIDHGNFQRAYPVQPLCPYPDEAAEFAARFRIGIAGAISGLLVSVALLVAATALFQRNEVMLTFAVAAFLLLLGLCTGALVYLGIQHSKYEPEPERPQGRDIDGAIMLTATAVFLLLGFWRGLWHPGWVVFPVGGILCGIVNALRKNR